jgi:hypothetical protein
VLHVEALQKALDALVARHESLRTTLVARDGNPVQMVAPAGYVDLAVIELTQWLEPERQAEADRRLRAAARRPFDLARDLLLRASLLRLEATEHLLLVSVHHIASDGWSQGVLFRELALLYDAFTMGKPAALPDLPIQYADYAVWQRQWLQGERSRR